jgi:hypothetical protein
MIKKVLLTYQFIHTFLDGSTGSHASGRLCYLFFCILLSQGMDGWRLINPSHASSERRECRKILFEENFRSPLFSLPILFSLFSLTVYLPVLPPGIH